MRYRTRAPNIVLEADRGATEQRERTQLPAAPAIPCAASVPKWGALMHHIGTMVGARNTPVRRSRPRPRQREASQCYGAGTM
jgi:hypothetical protein